MRNLLTVQERIPVFDPPNKNDTYHIRPSTHLTSSSIMYIRDAQGRLRWLPPQGFVQQVAAHQQSLRHHHMQEEWQRFNAPPPEDPMYFQTEHQQQQPTYYSFSGALPTGHGMASPHQVTSHHVGQRMVHSQIQQQGKYQPLYHPQYDIHHQQNPRVRVHPPIPRVIQSTEVSHREPIAFSPSFGSFQVAGLRNDHGRSAPPVNGDTGAPKMTNMNCMNALFGSSVKGNLFGKEANNRVISCNQLDSSTTEVEFNIQLPSQYMDFVPMSPLIAMSTNIHGNKNSAKGNDHVGMPSEEENSEDIGRTSPRVSTNPMVAFRCNGIHGLPNASCTKIHPTMLTPEKSGVGMFQGNGASGLPENMNSGTGKINEQALKKAPSEADLSTHESFDEISYLVDAAMFAPPPKTIRNSRRDGKNTKKKKGRATSTASSSSSFARHTLWLQKERVVDKAPSPSSSGANTISDMPLYTPLGPSELSNNPVHQLQATRSVSERNQVMLSQSVAEICRQRMLELMLEEYPSFEEPQPSSGSNNALGDNSNSSGTATTEDAQASQANCDTPTTIIAVSSYDVSSSSGENKPQKANANAPPTSPNGKTILIDQHIATLKTSTSKTSKPLASVNTRLSPRNGNEDPTTSEATIPDSIPAAGIRTTRATIQMNKLSPPEGVETPFDEGNSWLIEEVASC